MFQCQTHIGVGISPEAEEISKEQNTKIVLPLLVTAHEEKKHGRLGDQYSQGPVLYTPPVLYTLQCKVPQESSSCKILLTYIITMYRLILL